MFNFDAYTVEIPDFIAVTIGLLVFFAGAFLTRNIEFLKNYNIPEPVAGGIVAALITWIAFSVFSVEISFDLSTRDELLVIFFTTIGLNARLSDLIAGGRLLLILLFITIIFITLQNCVGLAGAILFDLPKPVSILLGSAALIGGHGTAIAWAPAVETATGFAAAGEIGIAAATLGLVCAALVGGPIAKFLIDRHKLEAGATEGPVVGLAYDTDGKEAGTVNHISIMHSFLAINVSIVFGYMLNILIADVGLKLPLFVPCLLGV